MAYTAPPPGWYGPDAEPEELTVPLSHYLWILKRHCWKILSFVAACVIATLIVSQRVTPIYESTAAIDVDRRMPAGILGQDSNQYPTMDADQFLATQVKLIQSDSVLRPVDDKYHLRKEDRTGSASAAIPGQASEPSPDRDGASPLPTTRARNAPVTLKQLKVTRPPNTYLLLISYRSPNPDLAADVANAVANSYILHTYNIRFRSSAGLAAVHGKAARGIKAKMESSAEALAKFERDLNVINPEEKTSILSARLLQLNTDYTTAQTERVRKEAAYNSIRAGEIRPPRSLPRANPSSASPRSSKTPTSISATSRPTTASTTPNTARPPPRSPRSRPSSPPSAPASSAASKSSTARPRTARPCSRKPSLRPRPSSTPSTPAPSNTSPSSRKPRPTRNSTRS